jgi:hypothetical protein
LPLFIATAFLFSLMSTVFGLAEMERASRLAADERVTARVIRAWVVHGRGGGPRADLAYERQQNDKIVHCEIANVAVGRVGRTVNTGDAITVSPRPDSCWEPDVVCETCPPEKPNMIFPLLFSAFFAAIGVFLLKKALKKAVTPASPTDPASP